MTARLIPFRFLFLGTIFSGCLFALTAQGAEVDDYTKTWQEKASAYYKEWQAAPTPEAKEKVQGKLEEAAIRSDQPGLVEEVTASGPVAPLEIKPTGEFKQVPLTVIKTFTEIPNPLENEGRGWLSRRITAEAFEVWSEKEGWLFDRQGKLLSHAQVPRRDGHGLEWYGAFLPDGQWITTDLWERDDTLFLYSREGQFIRDLPTSKILPDDPNHLRSGLIGWARSDAAGKGWVVSVGSEGGRGRIWIGPDFKFRILKGLEPWTLCYPRQLGARLFFSFAQSPSDDGVRIMTCWRAGHGWRARYSDYALRWSRPGDNLSDHYSDADHELKKGEFSLTFPDGSGNFGFWPHSANIYVVNSSGYQQDLVYKTWFFDVMGKCQGWLKGKRLADAADGRAMLFKTPEGNIVTLDPQLKVQAVETFLTPDGAPAAPHNLFADLHLGLFINHNKLVLATWK